MLKYTPLIFFYFLSTGKPNTLNAVASEDMSARSKRAAPAIINVTDSVPSAFLIILGKSIGLSAINTSATSLYKRLGKPSAEDASMGGKSLVTWYSKPVIHLKDTVVNEVEIYFTTPNFGMARATAKAQIIRITSPRFITREQVGVGASFKQLRRCFAKIKKIGSYFSPKAQQEVTIYDDVVSGIAFEVSQQQKCVGVTIHKAAEDPLTIYQGIFEDVKQ
jgi:hypothetical protein